MSRISRTSLAQAIATVDAMDMHQQEVLADEIDKLQPNLLRSILVLSNMGVPADRMGFPVRMLLVCFQAMKNSGAVWPTISEQDLSREMNRWISTVNMGSTLNSSLRSFSMHVYIDAHPEKDLLAYITTETSKWLSEMTELESDRYVMMAVQNLANCIAYADIGSPK